MMDTIDFNNVFKEDRGALSHGRIKVAHQGIIFKNSKTGKVEQIPNEDIKEINWQRIALEFGLRICLKNGSFYRFGGFHDYDFEKLSKFCEINYKINLNQKEICLKGFNWGVANFNGSLLSFDNDKATCFEIPLTNVSHCTSAKNEVTLEFHQNDDAPVSLMELRFHIPTQPDGPTEDPVQCFMDAVMNKASIIQATGESIATFSELQCLTPRGRYDIKIFPTFIQLHGKTFDYKIPLTTILRLFKLPHKDGRQVFFVLSLDPPIKQGQTRYHFLILLFNKEEEITMDISLPELNKQNLEGKLDKRLVGSTVDVLGQIMKILVQRKITLPGITGTTNQAITCSYKAQAGFLYPLERGFIFVHKPPVHIRFDEIVAVNFARSGGSGTKSFDFEVEAKSIVHTFNSIEKEEYSKLYDFVVSKKLRVKNRGTEKIKMDRVDEDELVDSDLEDEPDAYLHRVKHEGKLREQGDSEEESEDEDFKPDEESEVEEEYDSQAGSSSSESEQSEEENLKMNKNNKNINKKDKHEEKKKIKKNKKDKDKKEKDKDKDKKDKDKKLIKNENSPKNLKLTNKTFKSKEYIESSSDNESKSENEDDDVGGKTKKKSGSSGGGNKRKTKKLKKDSEKKSQSSASSSSYGDSD